MREVGSWRISSRRDNEKQLLYRQTHDEWVFCLKSQHAEDDKRSVSVHPTACVYVCVCLGACVCNYRSDPSGPLWQ